MLLSFILSFPLFLTALVIHEYAHGWVANKLGDPTARYFGRLTFNPIAHIDFVGTIILPIFLLLMRAPIVFGWAKPVPINFSFLKNPKRDMFWVSIAGPLANLLAAVFLAALLKLPILANVLTIKFLLSQVIVINVILAIFNLLPIHPLDGSRLLYSLLPDKLAAGYMKLEPLGMFILLGILLMGFMEKVIWPFVSLLLGAIL